MSDRFSAAERATYRQAVMRKGWEINQKLTALLAGQNVTMATIKLPGEEKPGLTPIEKVRLYLDLVMRARERLDTGGFGVCVDCGVEFAAAALDDTPWLERCGPCDAALATAG